MRRTACLALAVLALLPAACGDDDSSDDAGGETTTTAEDSVTTVTTTPADPGVPCEPVTLDPAALSDLRPDTVTAGYELQPDSVADTGPSDIDKAIADDGEDDAEQVLRAARFRRGYQWLWIAPDDSQLIGFLYEFCDSAGADAYADHALEATDLEAFEVAGLPGAEGFSGANGPVGVARVLAVHGPNMVVASANAELEQLSLEQIQAQATDLAKAMVAKLPPATG